MAGTPIKRKYLARIEAAGGITWVLDQVRAGGSVASIAKDLGMSRPFLSFRLNRDPDTGDALRIARALAAYDRIRARPNRRGVSEARTWVENGPAQFLEALKRVRQERIEAEARELSPAPTKLPDLARVGRAGPEVLTA
jgi:hypothetical protein